MPERDHAGVSHQQIERGGKKAHCRATDHEIEQRLAAGERRQRHQYEKRRERNQDVPIGPVKRFRLDATRPQRFASGFGLRVRHANSLPNRPAGATPARSP